MYYSVIERWILERIWQMDVGQSLVIKINNSWVV